jgi:hypothetical protein
MSGKTPEPKRGETAETSRYRVPPKPAAHRHGKASANSQTDQIDVIGPEDHAYGSDVVTRAGGRAHGLSDGHSKHRDQSSRVDRGERGGSK